MGSIINFLATILGYVFDLIYRILAVAGIHNMALCIFLFTVIVRLLMLPSTIKQQKFTRLNSIMQPEIKEIQKKYKDKKSQADQLDMQEDLRKVYDKYGVSPSGSCLQMIITMAILFPLYQVIRRIDEFVPSVAKLYKNKEANAAIIKELNKFFIFKIDQTPKEYFAAHQSEGMAVALIIALIIPVVAGLLQFLTVHITTKMNQASMDDNPMAGSLKIMNTIMPIFSAYLCWTFDVSIGIYWVTGSLITMVIQFIVNHHLSKIDVDTIIEENKEKAALKAAKRKEKQGIYREKILEASKTNARNISSNSGMSAAEKEEKIRRAKEAMEKKQGGLASKANLVSDYNKRNDK
ncbi:MAG: YidC/Oxa1 family membrane protein insertase [Lachnospiraceae bacterium]|nr:YidC/Oxa1 family membrane protein insertase [Lachnospiraceae bacterium]